MKRTLFSSLGILLIAASLAGMTISIFGIVGLWRLEADIKTSVNETLALLDTALQTTSDGLAVTSQSLDQADDSLISLVAPIQAAGKSVEETLPLINTLSTVTTHDLPQAISTSQQTIHSARVSASVIDSTMRVLAAIPLLPASLPVIKEKLRPSGVLIIDNMLWHARIFDPNDKSADTEGVHQFTRAITTDPNWIVTLLPLRDGVIVAYKR